MRFLGKSSDKSLYIYCSCSKKFLVVVETFDASSFVIRENSVCVYDIQYETTYACGKQPGVWGINGTFAGTITTLSDKSTKQIQIQ